MAAKHPGCGHGVSVVSLVLAVWVLPTACDSGSAPPEPTTLSLTPSTISFTALGQTQQVSASVRDQDGQVMAGAGLSWTSSAPSVASVSSAGLVTAAGNGTATVRATAGSASASVSVTVQQEASVVEVTPATATLSAIDETVQLAASAEDANGHAVSGASFTWSSSDEECATVDETGLVTAKGDGTVTVTASAGSASSSQAGRSHGPNPGSFPLSTPQSSHGSASGSATITIQQSVAAIKVAPGSITLTSLGETSQFTASAEDMNGHPVAGATFTWSSSNESVATVSSSGLVTAVGNGTATITVESDGEQETATVVVDAPTETVLYLRLDNGKYLSTEPRANPNPRGSFAPADWIALLGNDLPVGEYDFTLWFDLWTVDTKSFDVSLLARGTGPEVTLATVQITVQLPPDGSTKKVTGTLNVPAGASAGEKLILRIEGLGDGSGIVSVSQTEDSHVVVPGSVHVSRVPLAEVTVTPNDVKLDVAEEESLSTTITDIFGDVLEERRVTAWQTSDPTVATVNGYGDVTGEGAGQATLTATVDGVSGSATVSVFDQSKWEWVTGMSGSAASAAVAKDGTIYAAGTNLYALNPDGTLKWEYAASHPILWAPAIAPDGTIYAGYEGESEDRLLALNSDGTLKWEHAFTNTFTRGYKTSPALATDGTLYVVVGLYLHAIDPDGTVKWRYPFTMIQSTGGSYPAPSVAQDGTIYLSGIGSELRAFDSGGSLKWKFDPGASLDWSPAIGEDGTVYAGSDDGHLYAINPDGTLKWKYDTGGWVNSSPALAPDGTIYVGSGFGELHAINPDGTARWSCEPGGKVGSTTSSQSSPAVGADGTIYIGSPNGGVWAMNSDGTEKWHVLTDNDVIGHPTLAPDGSLYVHSEDGTLHAIRTGSNGLASSSWPKYRHDAKNTGNVSGG